MRFSALPQLLATLDLDDDGALGRRRPPREHVRTVQNSLSAWLADEDFYLDCVELELLAILRRTPDSPQPPLYRDDSRGLSLRMFYWWPGRTAPPHEHTAWTVTAVFYNALEVTTYDFDVAQRQQRLVTKNQFQAVQGAAGHIYDRCIHNPANRTGTIATSIHIFNASDTPKLEREVGPIAGMAPPTASFPRGRGERARVEMLRQRHLRALVQMVCQFRSPRALRTLQAIALAADSGTHMVVDRAQHAMRTALAR